MSSLVNESVFRDPKSSTLYILSRSDYLTKNTRLLANSGYVQKILMLKPEVACERILESGRVRSWKNTYLEKEYLVKLRMTWKKRILVWARVLTSYLGCHLNTYWHSIMIPS